VPFQSLSKTEWSSLSETHFQRVHDFAEKARKRASRREKHPVYDFLTKYYPFSLGKFEKWHPGIGVTLQKAERSRFSEKWYSYDSFGNCSADSSLISEKELERHRFTKTLLEKTQSRKPLYSCFGLHEWAMVYSGADIRHKESAPLRLSQDKIDEVVRSSPLVCTHFDAYRFFAPKAKLMNRHQPNLGDRENLEQPACIHVNMDLYKWAFKTTPWVGSDLIWDCFQLALKAREIDMRASPYDLSQWGYNPIFIETDEGKTCYQKKQKELLNTGIKLRSEIINVLEFVLS